jgi:putative two-component system response regulator
MLKRIAVVGGKDATVSEELVKAAKGKDIELVKVASKAKIPPAVVIAVADDAKASLAVSIADVLATRQEDMLYLLATAIDSREELAAGSSLRVKEHATRFAKALKLSAKDQATLERGALLRDIGKLRIPNCILLKYDLLTHDEWETIYRHSATGAEARHRRHRRHCPLPSRAVGRQRIPQRTRRR